MQAKAIPVLRFLGGTDKKFIVPIYQRTYSWTKANCMQLIKDIKGISERNMKSYFIGAICYLIDDSSTITLHEHLIDGQQRLTTISIFLIALINNIDDKKRYINEELNIDTRKIMNVYLKDEYANSDNMLKLKPKEEDQEAYERLFNKKCYIENSYITKNYKYFYKLLDGMNDEELHQLYENFQTVNIVAIKLEKDDDPQVIYESINSTGMELDLVDKIRNYVLMGIRNESELKKIYSEYWMPLIDEVNANNMDEFVRYYLVVKTNALFNKKEVYTEFKRYREQNYESIVDFLDSLLQYGKYYRFIKEPRKGEDFYNNLTRLKELKVDTDIPLIMNMFEAFDDEILTKDEMRNALDVIESYILRREVCNLQTNVLNKLFGNMSFSIKKVMERKGISYHDAFLFEIGNKQGKSRFPDNKEFKEKFVTYELYNSSSNIKKYILERLENFNNKEKVAVKSQLEENTLTIEHIMPQNLTIEWEKELGEDFESMHQKYLHTPGNLTLTAYNSEYSNNSFLYKRNMKEKGFEASKLRLNEYIKKQKKWGLEEILKRAELLAEDASKIWKEPKFLKANLNNEEKEIYNWDDNFDLTNKKIEEIYCLGTYYKPDKQKVANAVKKVNEILYSEYEEEYKESNFGWLHDILDNQRAPYELDEDMYIDMHGSSNEHLKRIKKMGEFLELDSEDIRFEIIE